MQVLGRVPSLASVRVSAPRLERGRVGSSPTLETTNKDLMASAAVVARHRTRKRAELIAYKGGSCELCGYSRCVAVLEFHHRDPALKLFPLSMTNCGKPRAILRAEADKCALLCANCHREIHAGIAHLEEQATDNRQV